MNRLFSSSAAATSFVVLAWVCLASFCTPAKAQAAVLRDSFIAAPASSPSFPTLVAVDSASTAAQDSAKKFISQMGARGINFLGDPNMSQEAKTREFAKLLNESFDMDTIGRFALGNYWRSASAEQRREYLSLFKEMIIRTYAKRFSDYKGQEFDVQSARPINEKDMMVTSFIVPEGNPKVQVDWRVRSRGNGYKVVDIVVEGVSMTQTQRSDFASVIQRGGGDIDALLTSLRP